LPILSAVRAADEGQVGQTFPIIETDLLAAIAGRLRGLEASGEIAAMQQRFAAQAEASVRRPAPVSGLSPATAQREWLYDPSIVTEQAIRDGNGNVIAPAGTRINPLSFVSLREDLVFVDGTDETQVDWATRRWNGNAAKIIFVAGSPFEAMKPHQRRFYFDQGGKLTARFGIAHVPAVVSQAGDALQVIEIPLGNSTS
jgi:conjugal transfer pilus assembly protein TraW